MTGQIINGRSQARGRLNEVVNSYVVRWKTDFYSRKQNTQWNLRILDNQFIGSPGEIDVMGEEALEFRNRGGRDVIDDLIISTEATFKFWLKDTADQTEYQDLFQADERQFMVEAYRDGFLYYVGYLDPSSTGRQFVGNQQMVLAKFSDQLKTLKEYTLVDNLNAPLVGEYTGLEIIKECLQYTDIELPIKVQLGTYEKDLMTSTECALEKVNHKMIRFNKQDDGLLVAEDCKTALNEILKLYNCQIRQLDGAYVVTNILESDSFIFTFDWATLTEQSRVAYNSEISLDPAFRDKGTLSFVAPLKQVDIKFRNRYEGDNVFSNGDFDSGLTGWSNGAGPSNDFDTFNVSSETNPRLNLAASDNNAKYFESDLFGLTVQGSNDSIYVKLKAEVFSITYTAPNPAPRAPFLYFSIVYPDTTEVFGVTQGMLEGGNFEYEGSFPLNQNGNYKLRVWFEPNTLGQIDNVAYRVDDIYLKALYENGQITYDELYQNYGEI